MHSHWQMSGFRRGRRTGSARGASLLAIIVGLAVLGIAVAVMATFLDQSYARLTALQDAEDRRALRNYLNYSVNCTRTQQLTPVCAKDSYVKLVGVIGGVDRTIVAETGKSPTKIGKWEVRGRCESGNELVVEVRKSGKGAFDPLFKSVPFSCQY